MFDKLGDDLKKIDNFPVENQLHFMIAPMIDLVTMSGLILLMSKFTDKSKLEEIVVKYWNNYFKDDAENKLKKIFDLHYRAESIVCNNCGAFLRGREYEEKYNCWLEETYKGHRDKFQIECHFSKDIIECMKKYLADHPGTSLNAFTKALVVIYFNVVDRDEKKSIQLESLLEQEILKSLTNDGDKRKLNIQFAPKMMIELIAIAESLDVGPSVIVEEVVMKLMTAFVSQDPRLREFWGSEIHGKLDMILKAA